MTLQYMEDIIFTEILNNIFTCILKR